jgi:LacI family transcriptional regulator
MATIRDVARESGVSIATVSRVFNHSPLVSGGTRERVLGAAERLGYWPNGIARSLITNRTHAVGVLLPELHGEFFSELIHGVDLAARAHGLHLLVSRATSTAAELTAALRSMRGRVDALIVMAPDPDASAALRDCAGQVPAVLLNTADPEPEYDTLTVANFDGAFEIVRHLIRLGHREIATISGPEHNVDARQRLEGYRAALRDGGLTVDPRLEFPGDFTEPSGYAAAARVLAREPRPTALFVANDHMVIGVLGALQDAGVRVPEDLAIAGFDDIPMARYLTPPLTTVHVDLFRMGQRAMELLLENRRGGPPTGGRHEVLATTLVVRGSCGAHAPENGDSTAWHRHRSPAVTRR